MSIAKSKSVAEFVEMAALEDRRYRSAIAKFSASFMSDAKWLKFFHGVISSGVLVGQAAWQYLGAPSPIWQSFPEEHDLMPTRFADGKFQPWEYRWLEWVFIPAAFKPTPDVGYERKQDVAAVVAKLEAAGQFPIEVSAAGLTLRAYR